MHTIPLPARLLGFAGVIPFLWAALTNQITNPLPFARFGGAELAVGYGIVILCFMSGVLWGFAARGKGLLPYGLSVTPALYVFFTTGWGQSSDSMALIAGYLGILGFDLWFQRMALAPEWWMALRLRITAIVVPSLAIATI